MVKSPGIRQARNRCAATENTTNTISTVRSHFNMIELYTWSTPNGRKVSIMLEECALPYNVHDPEGPDGKPMAMMESGAILIYLAGKTGKFLPKSARGKYAALQWLMFQMGGVGPMFGQAHHFMRAKKDDIPYGSERYGNEAKRLYGVMDRHLASAQFFAKEYSIADMAIYPWVARHEWHRVDLGAFPNVKRWYDAVGARPAVVKGMAVPA
jgi:GST-like protein